MLGTFISALESSPVHCLKFLPSGKRLRPAKDGASAMLDNRFRNNNEYMSGGKLTADQYHQVSSVLLMLGVRP